MMTSRVATAVKAKTTFRGMMRVKAKVSFYIHLQHILPNGKKIGTNCHGSFTEVENSRNGASANPS
jgi:hypothetical protein